MTAELTEMPRSRSTAIQSERTRRRSPRALTSPAIWMAPPNSNSFSVSVVLPASGWEMMAKVRLGAATSDGAFMIGALLPSAAMPHQREYSPHPQSLFYPPLAPLYE